MPVTAVVLALGWMLTGALGAHLIERARRLDGLGVPLGLTLGPVAWPLLLMAVPAGPSAAADPAADDGGTVRLPVGVLADSSPGPTPVDDLHPDVVAALQSPEWRLDHGHLVCRSHRARYCATCSRDLG
jgi:hypothetical protein